MLAPAIARVLDRAVRGESLATAAAAEGVSITESVELDACHDGKPVCCVRPLALLDSFPVFAESPAAAPILASRRASLARALNRPVGFLAAASWTTTTPGL